MGLLDADGWTGRIHSSGWIAGAGTAKVTEPATGAALGTIGLADAADVDRAGAAAAAAQRDWAGRPFSERAAVLRAAARILGDARTEVAEFLTRETGGTRRKGAHETTKAVDELVAAAALADRPYGELLPHEDATVLSMARRVPLGVVGVITPWNAPLMLAIRSVAPALVLGNAVLLKPDIRTAVSGGVVLARVFEEAGLPPGVLHVLPGDGATGAAVVRSPHTASISFTGSSAVGRRIGEIAGGLLKRVSLELGGNNAFVVLEDADLDLAVNNGLAGAVRHQGQICMATGRHLVHTDLADAYVERLTAAAESLVVGDPTRADVQLGPLIDVTAAERVHALVTDSVADGAVLRTGGSHDGPFYRPTVLAEVSPGSRAFREEIFGPVMPVTRFADDADAARLATATGHGLSAAVHTGSTARGLALAARMGTGMVHVNGQTINDAPHVPMGGMGESGNGGRFGGHWNLEEFTAWQWVTTRPGPTRLPV